jgi:cation:H+ antiporter
MLIDCVILVFGIGLIIEGGGLFVSAAVRLAYMVTIGTSLPEMATAVVSARKAVSDIAVGNVLGANIANLSLTVRTAAAISDVRMSCLTQLLNFPAMLVMFALLLWMLVTDRRGARKEGVILLAFYSFNMAALVLFTAALK